MLGFIIRIVYTRIIGDYGISLISIATPTYSLLLTISTLDKLILYAILIAGVHIIVTSLYVLTCVKKYSEINISNKFNKEIFNGMLGFTSWTAVANLSNTMIVQG